MLLRRNRLLLVFTMYDESLVLLASVLAWLVARGTHV